MRRVPALMRGVLAGRPDGCKARRESMQRTVPFLQRTLCTARRTASQPLRNGLPGFELRRAGGVARRPEGSPMLRAICAVQAGIFLAGCSGSDALRPPAASQASVVYDEARSRLVVFGGQSTAGLSGETWTWDGTKWTLAARSGPPARTGSAAVYDSGRARIVLFGGDSGTARLSDTWEWDGSAWTQMATAGPDPRSFHRLAYDRRRSRTVLFGGSSGGSTFPAATWEWNGSQWSQSSAAGPSGRFLRGDGVRRIAPAHGAVRRVRRREHARRHLGMGWDRLATIGCGPCRPRPREHDLRSGAAGARPVRRGRNLAAQRPGLVAYPRPRPDGA